MRRGTTRRVHAVLHGTLASLLSTLAGAGCGTPRSELEWSLRFDPPALEQPGSTILARVLDEGCESGRTIQEWELQRGDQLAGGVDDATGRVGLWARAADASCNWYARGCVEVEVPLRHDARVDVVLRAEDPRPRCAPEACTDGLCAADAGSAPGPEG